MRGGRFIFMFMISRYVVFRLFRSGAIRFLRNVAAGAAVLFSMIVPGPAAMAQQSSPSGNTASVEAPPSDLSPAMRRADLRRALSVREEGKEAGGGKRRLSAEERSALRQELREAAQGAYPDAGSGRRKPPR